MQVDIPAALQELAHVAARIEELLEWDKLAQQERRPHVPPAFQLRDHVSDEIVGLYSAFLTLAGTIHRALDGVLAPLRPGDAEALRRSLGHLEDRVARWHIGERFIKP